jgi:hypothetical protein
MIMELREINRHLKQIIERLYDFSSPEEITGIDEDISLSYPMQERYCDCDNSTPSNHDGVCPVCRKPIIYYTWTGSELKEGE